MAKLNLNFLPQKSRMNGIPLKLHSILGRLVTHMRKGRLAVENENIGAVEG